MKYFLLQLLQYIRYIRAKIATKSSYAQHGEDIEIEKHIGKVRTFVDIGANDGYSVSNTFRFAVKGARGVCFEPVPSIFTLLKRLYQFNKKVICLNYGISDVETTTEIVSAGVLSYLKNTVEQEHLKLVENHLPDNEVKETIRLIPFSKIMKTIDFPAKIDLLSIDVEGHELNVLKGIDFSIYEFGVIVVETHAMIDNKTVWKHKHLSDIEMILSENNYHKTGQTQGNSFYQKK